MLSYSQSIGSEIWVWSVECELSINNLAIVITYPVLWVWNSTKVWVARMITHVWRRHHRWIAWTSNNDNNHMIMELCKHTSNHDNGHWHDEPNNNYDSVCIPECCVPSLDDCLLEATLRGPLRPNINGSYAPGYHPGMLCRPPDLPVKPLTSESVSWP